MVLPFNTFTIHDLVGFAANGFLAVTFYLLYFNLGRRKLDLLSANFIACAAGSCLSYFLSDNVVPAGLPSTGWPHGPTGQELAYSTLQYHRMSWVFAMFSLVTQLHFVLEYSQRWAWLRRRIRWAYALDLALIPLIWTPLWMEMPSEPLAETASWSVAIPWIPVVGLPALLFAAAWYALVIFSVVIFLLHLRRHSQEDSEYASQKALVLLAFLAQMLAVTVDIIFIFTGFCGPAASPVGSTVMGIILGVALMRARLASDRQRQRLEREANEALRTTHIKLLHAREEERRHVAHELHDSIAQSLVSLQLRLRSQARSSLITAGQSAALLDLAGQCKEAVQEVRHLCEGLYPAPLDLVGLPASLERVLNYWRLSGKEGDLDHPPNLLTTRFAPEVEIAVFRACQEAFNNAMRHAQAQRIDLSLDYDGQELRAAVTDNGVGFDPHDVRRHGMGMNTMRGRIEGIGGRVTITSRPGHTRLEFRVPCEGRASTPGIPACAGQEPESS